MEPPRIDYYNDGDFLHIKNLDVNYPDVTKHDIVQLYADISEAISIFTLSVCASFLRDETTLKRGIPDAEISATVVKAIANAHNHEPAINEFVDMICAFFDKTKTPGGSFEDLKKIAKEMKTYAKTYVRGQIAVIGVAYNGPTVYDD